MTCVVFLGYGSVNVLYNKYQCAANAGLSLIYRVGRRMCFH